MKQDPLNVLIVDDHAGFRRSLRSALSDVEDLQVIAECSNGAEAVAFARTDKVDVILMDIQMPGVDGIQATRSIHEFAPHIGILMLSMIENHEAVIDAIRAGARGYLLKGSGRREICTAIRAVAQGDAIFGQALASRLMDVFSAATSPPQKTSQSAAMASLSEREHDVLRLLGQGLGTREMALALSLSEKTVRNHISNIFTKLQVTDRVQAVLRAQGRT